MLLLHMVDSIGLRLCSRYAFGPNSLHYCGPEKQSDMAAYVTQAHTDAGLVEIVNKFDTLWAYLVLIASQNHIQDPLDRRVVEAYWIGNKLLGNIRERAFGDHLAYALELKKKLPLATFSREMNRVAHGVPNHNFHVMNIYIRTGHHAIVHTLTTMDECRISWGKIKDVNGSSLLVHGKEFHEEYLVETRPLVYINQKLCLGEPVIKKVTSIGLPLNTGDWVSLHWGYVCAVLSMQEKKNLIHTTRIAIANANAPI